MYPRLLHPGCKRGLLVTQQEQEVLREPLQIKPRKVEKESKTSSPYLVDV